MTASGRDGIPRREPWDSTGQDRSLLESVTEGILIQAADGRILFANTAAATLLDRPKSALAAAALPAPPLFTEDGAGFDWTRHLRQWQPSSAPRILGLREREGIRWLRLSTSRIAADDQAEAESFVSTLLDITELMETRQALTRREDTFHAMFDHCFEFIGQLSPEGILLEANRTALEAVGVRLEEVVGKPFWDTPWWNHSPDEQARLRAAVRAAATGRFVRYETRHPGPAGLLWIDFSLKPVFNDQGDVRWLIPEGRDVTLRKRHEMELAEAKAAAESASQSKSQFVATMSHELRTPLNAILGYSELILSETFGPLNRQIQDYLHHIHSAGTRLLEEIQNILDIACIETNSLDLILEPLPPAQVAERAIALVAHHAEQKSLTLDVQSDSRLDPFPADRKRMVQVLVNLLLNAIKFTERGGRMGLEVRQTGAETRFCVWDTGAGIDPAHLKRIWEPFGRVESAYLGGAGGAGLGLTLARHLVELQGGEISLDSHPGQGCRVTLRFPAPSSAAPKPWRARQTLKPSKA